jgi:hypothetical protein
MWLQPQNIHSKISYLHSICIKKIQNKTNENQKNTIHGKKTIGQSGENEAVSNFVLSEIKTHC